MAYNDFSGESPPNYEPKCLWVLVLDTSGSMKGSIDEINVRLQDLKKAISDNDVAAERVEISIVEFNSKVKIKCAPKNIYDIDMPKLTVTGTTKLVDGVRRAIQVAETRKAWYKGTGQTFYRPFVILMTDGVPDGDQDIKGLKQEVDKGIDGKHFVFKAFGVRDADIDMLKKISHPNYEPIKLENCDFNLIFAWLSTSIDTLARSTDTTDTYKAIEYIGNKIFQKEC